jgi:hypothetical protein
MCVEVERKNQKVRGEKSEGKKNRGKEQVCVFADVCVCERERDREVRKHVRWK